MTPAVPASCARCGTFLTGAAVLCEACAAREAALAEPRARVRRLARHAAAAGGLSALVLGFLALKVYLASGDTGMISFGLANLVPLGLWSGLVLALRRSWPTVFFFGWLMLVGAPGDFALAITPEVSVRAVVVVTVSHVLQGFALVQLVRLRQANKALTAAQGRQSPGRGAQSG